MRLPVDEATAEAVSRAFRLQGFFPEFSAELCAKVFARSGVYQYRRGEKIVAQGDAGRDLYTAAQPTFAFRLTFEDVGYILKNNPELAGHLSALVRERRP